MRTCTPQEFLARWPGGLHPVALPDPPPDLSEDCRRLLTEFGLPRELRIECYNTATLRFSGAATPLAAIWERERERGGLLGEMPAGWSRFWHLADQEYLQGGGWVCIEEGAGRLVVIDLDQSEGNEIYLLNSGLRTFYATLAHFLDWSEATDGGTEATIRLRDELRQQECVPPAELEPFWLNFIEATLDGDPLRLAVSLSG